MAGVSYLVYYVLVSLFNPVSRFLYGHDHQSNYQQAAIAQNNLHDQQKALFVFGDSLFDAGNNQYLNTSAQKFTGSVFPYGETFFQYPTGRLSDGRLLPDFIAMYGNVPILLPYLQPGEQNYTAGTNFASAGAGVLVDASTGAIDLPTQLSYFKEVIEKLNEELGDDGAKNLLEEAVYLISMGGNDYFGFYSDNTNSSETLQQQFIAMVIGNLTSFIKEVYDLGGMKFAIQNVGPLGCLPATKLTYSELTGDCVDGLSALASLHNAALADALQEIESELTGFKYSILEYYTAITDRINNPAEYGFTDSVDACCGNGTYRAVGCGGDNGTEAYELCSNPAEYVWFDGGHTTEELNLQMADLMWNGTLNVTWPYNVKQFFE